MNIHQCENMSNDNYPNPKPDYIYKWTGDEFGWQLYVHGKPSTNLKHTWLSGCSWCGMRFDVIDTMIPYDTYKIHRCQYLIRHEWSVKRNELSKNKFNTKGHLFIKWDGYEYWNQMCDDEIIDDDKLTICLYCDQKLIDPRTLCVNKVEII